VIKDATSEREADGLNGRSPPPTDGVGFDYTHRSTSLATGSGAQGAGQLTLGLKWANIPFGFSTQVQTWSV
jgi:hypothetical protein